MKKSKMISLVLVSASFTGCSTFYLSGTEPNYVSGRGNDTIPVVYPTQPYYFVDNYNYWYWHPFWQRPYYLNYCRHNHLCNHTHYYGPHHNTNTNTVGLARETKANTGPVVTRVSSSPASVARGGFGHSAVSAAA